MFRDVKVYVYIFKKKQDQLLFLSTFVACNGPPTRHISEGLCLSPSVGAEDVLRDLERAIPKWGLSMRGWWS